MGEVQASEDDGCSSELQKHENKMKVRQMKISEERQMCKSRSSRKGEPSVTIEDLQQAGDKEKQPFLRAAVSQVVPQTCLLGNRRKDRDNKQHTLIHNEGMGQGREKREHTYTSYRKSICYTEGEAGHSPSIKEE